MSQVLVSGQSLLDNAWRFEPATPRKSYQARDECLKTLLEVVLSTTCQLLLSEGEYYSERARS